MNSNYAADLPLGTGLTKVTENEFSNTRGLMPKHRLMTITKTIRVIEITFFLIMASWGNLPQLSSKAQHKSRFYRPIITGIEQTSGTFNLVRQVPLTELTFNYFNA